MPTNLLNNRAWVRIPDSEEKSKSGEREKSKRSKENKISPERDTRKMDRYELYEELKKSNDLRQYMRSNYSSEKSAIIYNMVNSVVKDQGLFGGMNDACLTFWCSSMVWQLPGEGRYLIPPPGSLVGQWDNVGTYDMRYSFISSDEWRLTMGLGNLGFAIDNFHNFLRTGLTLAQNIKMLRHCKRMNQVIKERLKEIFERDFIAKGGRKEDVEKCFKEHFKELSKKSLTIRRKLMEDYLRSLEREFDVAKTEKANLKEKEKTERNPEALVKIRKYIARQEEILYGKSEQIKAYKDLMANDVVNDKLIARVIRKTSAFIYYLPLMFGYGILLAAVGYAEGAFMQWWGQVFSDLERLFRNCVKTARNSAERRVQERVYDDIVSRAVFLGKGFDKKESKFIGVDKSFLRKLMGTTKVLTKDDVEDISKLVRVALENDSLRSKASEVLTKKERDILACFAPGRIMDRALNKEERETLLELIKKIQEGYARLKEEGRLNEFEESLGDRKARFKKILDGFAEYAIEYNTFSIDEKIAEKQIAMRAFNRTAKLVKRTHKRTPWYYKICNSSSFSERTQMNVEILNRLKDNKAFFNYLANGQDYNRLFDSHSKDIPLFFKMFNLDKSSAKKREKENATVQYVMDEIGKLYSDRFAALEEDSVENPSKLRTSKEIIESIGRRLQKTPEAISIERLQGAVRNERRLTRIIAWLGAMAAGNSLLDEREFFHNVISCYENAQTRDDLMLGLRDLQGGPSWQFKHEHTDTISL